jgi:hypothetical protein
VLRWCGSTIRIVLTERFITLAILPLFTCTMPALAGVAEMPCPSGALNIEPGGSFQVAVDHAGAGATFCLKNGLHRMQIVRPRAGQSFYGEGQTVLNGSRLLTEFSREGPYWVASWPEPYGPRHGKCAAQAPACNLPESLFFDDQPFEPVLSKEQLRPRSFYIDRSRGLLYFLHDPSGHKVEATAAAVAFEGTAPYVRISNLAIEKYASPAQKGAIQAQTTATGGWLIENCEVRLNSGAGIAVGNRSQVRSCDIHHNGQIGITGVGDGVVIENNRIWANNTRGFESEWEAGGVKLAASEGTAFRGNQVYDNFGPGLWCDINCRNVLYEDNLVERNQSAGLFYEISYNAAIRRNIARHNGLGHKGWFGHVNILVAASESVDVSGNILIVDGGGCGIILMDQGRSIEGNSARRGKYKTSNNTVHGNETTFEGAGCAGGASDVAPGDENFAIIEDGNNTFDGNVYRFPAAGGSLRFEWGHQVLDWDGLRRRGLEPNGELVRY